MSDALRSRIAVIAASHVYNEWHVEDAEQCYCGKCGPSWPDHLADMVAAELGLTREYVHHGSGSMHRYVTEWRNQ